MREIGHEMPKQDQSTFTVESSLTFTFWGIELLSSSCHFKQKCYVLCLDSEDGGFPRTCDFLGIVLCPGLLLGKAFLHKIDPGGAQRVVRTRAILCDGKLSI